MKKYFLDTIYNRQKSFYKKAVIFEDEKTGDKWLISYDTLVAKIIDDKIYRCWSGYSKTTQNHINEFLDQNGFGEHTGKKAWSEVEYNNEIEQEFKPIYDCFSFEGTLSQVSYYQEKYYYNF